MGWAEAIVNEALAPQVTAVITPELPPDAGGKPPSNTGSLQSQVAEQPLVEGVGNPTEIQQKPKRNNWLKIGIVILLLLIVLGGTGIFFWQLSRPERVVVAAMSNLIKNDATQYGLTAELQSLPRTGQNLNELPFSNTKLTIEAMVDEAKPSQGQIFVKLFEPGDSDPNSNGDIGSLEIRWLENTLYYRLDYEYTAKEVALFGLDQFIGKWFSIDIQKTLDAFGATEQYNLELSEDKTQLLIDAYQKNPFLSVTASLGSETIADQQAKGYQLTYHKEKLANWLAESEIITAQPNPRGAEEINKGIPDPTEIGTIKIWIATKTKLPVRLEYELTPTTDRDGLTAVITLKNIGQSFTVEKPNPVTPLDEMIQQLQGDFFGASGAVVSGAREWLLSASSSTDTVRP